MIHLRIVTPVEILLDVTVRWLRAESPDGCFAILPHHIDLVTKLTPGVVVYEDVDGHVHYAGTGAATLVKRDENVLVSTRNVVLGEDLGEIQRRVATEFRKIEESERQERSAVARMEALIMRRFRDLEELS